ncbi:oligopeptide/dipeptide ABC transporter ATP-binding protein [Kribbella aluminosa]|uniref:Oligopeptide/dipeptide ABC transporter ATP-binding protein n=1 Tax=Kribbella aluminosa TaxID=416017 RepID=A0ABS4UMY8_9ACTN|nr:ABC transporter ATP-binding protein [Kribbella aluminosa]MBP2353017.1 oligopeptide/dipeptide ABC transporter ATP-binding protein [Kribbella aluminosa]
MNVLKAVDDLPTHRRDARPLLEAQDLVKVFGTGVRAVSNVSLSVAPGETLGIVGESGCGKSTTAKMMLRLLTPDSGRVLFDGEDVHRMKRKKLKELRRRLQVVPQNPQTSLNPRLSIGESIDFNMAASGYARSARQRRIPELLDRVGLDPSYGDRYPHQLSGGQLQRAAIARALATEPELVVCDEAVSALDKSVQAQVLNLLSELQTELGLAYLFISHDLAVVEHISDRVAVMYLGRVVEAGPAEQIWNDPRHPYNATLLSSTPGLNRSRIVLAGELPNPASPPSGCGFRTRCPLASEACATDWPVLTIRTPGHYASCIHQEPMALMPTLVTA